MTAVWQLLFAFFPPWFQAAVLGLIALAAIFLIFKLVALVLDSIPFL